MNVWGEGGKVVLDSDKTSNSKCIRVTEEKIRKKSGRSLTPGDARRQYNITTETTVAGNASIHSKRVLYDTRTHKLIDACIGGRAAADSLARRQCTTAVDAARGKYLDFSKPLVG